MESSRDHKLDLMKAACIFLIFFYHIPPFSFLEPEQGLIWNFLDSALTVFIYAISLVGVPSFFLVSLYLFYHKKSVEKRYERKRFKRLLALYLFWSAVQIGLYYLIFKLFPPFNWELARSGGPDLPIAGGSVFYFLFNLIVLTLVSQGFLLFSEKTRLVLAVIVFALSFIIFEITAFSSSIISSHADLLNFIYIVPLAYLLVEKQAFLVRHKASVFFVYLFFVLHDFAIWKFFDFNWPIYGRTSIALGALTLFCFIVGSRYRYRRAIAVVAKYSLGIFALHKYAKMAAYALVKKGLPLKLAVSGLDAGALMVFLISAILTFGAIYILSRIRLKSLVS
jgi:hypothetical protein